MDLLNGRTAVRRVVLSFNTLNRPPFDAFFFRFQANCVQTIRSISMRAFIFFLAMLVVPPAHAETSVRGFLEEYSKATDDGKRLLDVFLSGLIAAYGWSNITLKTDHHSDTARRSGARHRTQNAEKAPRKLTTTWPPLNGVARNKAGWYVWAK